jgi:phenylalanyl-tRNA synthetase alpha chain
MEGVRTYSLEELKPYGVKDIKEAKIVAERDLKETLENLSRFVFGDVEMRWNPDNFPFTDPSLELEIFYNNEWLEILGSGVILDGVMINAGKNIENEVGYAFGLGLERWAMKLFEIPDIRLFWTEDQRFTSQFQAGGISKFKPYSKYPTCYKDVTFWVPSGFNENNFHELIREIAGDLVESVELIDDFHNKKLDKRSNCFRINYRDMNRSLTNAEIDVL